VTGIRPLATAVIVAAGVAVTVAAFGWWMLTYWPVWSYNYLPLAQASRCLLADSTICRLAASLCTGQHRALVSIYSPWVFWCGACLLIGGAMAQRVGRR
jgi:hypothetical protein